jgi:hypothetical protein
MGERRVTAVAIAAVMLCPAASAAHAGTSVIATVNAETPISAGGGWLVWSVPVAGGWGLEAYHEGTVRAIRVAPRPRPFDVSVGTDAHGDPVATFSRCSRTPKMRDVGETAVTGGSLLEPQSGAGCRIHVLELASGRESQTPIPHPAVASDTTPSIWRGSVAFARRAPGHGDVWQVMLWSPTDRQTLRTLRHGAIPSHCRLERGGCSAPMRGTVEALDRNGAIVTFLWRVEGPGVAGEGAWEVRVDDLANGHSSLAEAGFGHEACTGPPTGLEYVWPERPVADGRLVLFPQLEGFACFRSFASVLGSYRVGARRSSSGGLTDTVLSLAKDGGVIYGLVPPSAQPGTDSPSCSAAAPCTLERLVQPRLTPNKFTPAAPFVEDFIR